MAAGGRYAGASAHNHQIKRQENQMQTRCDTRWGRRQHVKLRASHWVVAVIAFVLACGAGWGLELYSFSVLPPEHKHTMVPEPGTGLLFLTTNPADDTNLYYEQRSWLADSSLILLNSARENAGLMGYLTETGELVRVSTPRGGLSSATAAPNWWHASGHESGRWAAADNRHGDIGLFHGKTTRTYGSGRHPEVGSDRGGQQVIFASHMLGNVDVCGNNPGEVAAGMGKTILAI